MNPLSSKIRSAVGLLAAIALATACGGEAMVDDGLDAGTQVEMDAASVFDSGTTADSGTIADSGATPDTGTVVGDCNAPPLLNLDSIPDQPSLDNENPDTVAIFEVDGHDLIGKFVRDREAAEGGLRLWQEIMMRIPANQLGDLVQFDIYNRTDPIGYFNRTGSVTTERFGLKIGFSTENFTRNQSNICAPFEPRRGTFDWTLIHEFGHLRGYVDGSWFRFLDTFADVRGEGDGYPDDGSPVLTGEFVSSYAERADGDEDYAESFTAYMMLPDSAIPPEAADEPGAVAKIRWVSREPGMAQLRGALRITEPDGSTAPIDPAPSLFSSPIDYQIPAALHGTWQEVQDSDNPPTGEGRRLVITSDDWVSSLFTGGVESERTSLVDLRRDELLFGYSTQGDFAPNANGDRIFAFRASVHRVGRLIQSVIATDPAPSGAIRVFFGEANAFEDVLMEKLP